MFLTCKNLHVYMKSIEIYRTWLNFDYKFMQNKPSSLISSECCGITSSGADGNIYKGNNLQNLKFPFCYLIVASK